MHQTFFHMHSFSIQDKTVTFQYENVIYASHLTEIIH